MKNKTMFERSHFLDDTMSLEKLVQAKNDQSSVFGKVVMWDSQANAFKVSLGNGYSGILPLEYASIYPTTTVEGKLSAAARSIIGNTIQLKVRSIDTFEQVILSRVELMRETFNLISHSIGEYIECCVTSIVSYGVFVDVGNGISGLIHYKQLTVARLKDFSEILKIGDIITVKIINVTENLQVSLNYKDLYPNLSYTLNQNDLIEVTILERLNSAGCFAYVNPNTPAVIDMSSDIICEYGDKVVGRVKKKNPEHPERIRLSFVSFV